MLEGLRFDRHATQPLGPPELRLAIAASAYRLIHQYLGWGELTPTWDDLTPELREIWAKLGDAVLVAYARHGAPQSSGDFYRYVDELMGRLTEGAASDVQEQDR